MTTFAALQATKGQGATFVKTLSSLDASTLRQIIAFHEAGVATTHGFLEPRGQDYFQRVANCPLSRVVVAQDVDGEILAQAVLLGFNAIQAFEVGAVTHSVGAVALQERVSDPSRPMAVVQSFYSPFGAGPAVMHRIKSAALEIGAAHLCGVVKANNITAQKFFGKFGLEPIATWQECNRGKVLLHCQL